MENFSDRDPPMVLQQSFRILLVLGLALSSALVQGARGADVRVAVSPASVVINMNLELKENLTALPLFNVFLDSSNSSAVFGPIQSAAQSLVPTANISLLSAQVGTSLVNASIGLWLLQENYTLTVSGVNTNTGATVESSLGFLSMNVAESMILSGREINQVGAAYLLEPLETLPSTSTTRYFFDGGTYLNTAIPGNGVSTFHLLDFSWVPPVSSWSHQYDPFGSSKWTLPTTSPFNLTIGVRQVENIFLPLYVAVYSSSIDLTAPSGAWSDGERVIFYVSTPADVLMPSIIVVSLAVLIAAFVLDSRLTRRIRVSRKK